MNVCKRVLYQGHVQGVGFRYTTHGLARRFAVAGYVRNLPDGRVEVVVEGADQEVSRFLQALARQMAEYIEHREEHDHAATSLTTFEIRL
jgi:acylphosphatase